MHWNQLTEESQFRNEILKEGNHLLLKHSERCSISLMALKRLERSDLSIRFEGVFWVLDVLKFKSLSTQIAQDFGIHHESPQVIIISNKKVIHFASHGSIDPDQINL
tara:strand:- start:826 stop:1146 length:321 start_codon:yes stop_codon:yes gene_type:complete